VSHLLARISQIPAKSGGSKEVGREYMNAIHFCPVFYRSIMDNKRNHFYLVLFKENPFFYCLDQILVQIRAVLEMARSPAIGGPYMDKDSLITGTICYPISICALGTRTHKPFITTEPNLYFIANGRMLKL
jgi:hypothetical protein